MSRFEAHRPQSPNLNGERTTWWSSGWLGLQNTCLKCCWWGRARKCLKSSAQNIAGDLPKRFNENLSANAWTHQVHGAGEDVRECTDEGLNATAWNLKFKVRLMSMYAQKLENHFFLYRLDATLRSPKFHEVPRSSCTRQDQASTSHHVMSCHVMSCHVM